jgi:glyoxylase-like metal-dependent hydrolase (beta-lactamase superfamily II)
MREIVPGIFMWSWFSEPHGYNFNGFLVHQPTGNICVDPVEPTPEASARLARDGVAWIVLTNRNHTRRADLVREQTRARVMIHPADAAHASAQGTSIDQDLTPGSRVGPLEIVSVPGKSPGEVVLRWPERRLLIVGDAVIGKPPGQLSLLRERVMDDPRQLRQSLRQLPTENVEIVLTADGEPILHDAGARLRELVATFVD